MIGTGLASLSIILPEDISQVCHCPSQRSQDGGDCRRNDSYVNNADKFMFFFFFQEQWGLSGWVAVEPQERVVSLASEYNLKGTFRLCFPFSCYQPLLMTFRWCVAHMSETTLSTALCATALSALVTLDLTLATYQTVE